ncbi:hypothetical protein AAL_05930 [Moelleriella libera RCEF 2490]|uniref:AMP-dependent synthetase/ligase n=1 Tax=Moelleriella libera RCEF 2490 TaxID=1081109 RepID=A0A167ZND4_9HYPO|nr:hypothetical protein AAL_05930 [Moelleriella libera RCEF 2490]
MAHLTKNCIDHTQSDFGELKVLDDVVRHRAGDDPPAPILGYPRTHDRVDDYEQFIGRQVDNFIDAAVRYHMRAGLATNKKEVIAIHAPSDIDFVVTLFALSRLGYTVMCPSLRLAPLAIKNLLEQTNRGAIAHGTIQHISETLQAVLADNPLKSMPVPDRAVYSSPRSEQDAPFRRRFDPEHETDEMALIHK